AAGYWRDISGKGPQQGRLAGAVGAKYCPPLAPFDLESQVLNEWLAVTDGQVFGTKHVPAASIDGHEFELHPLGACARPLDAVHSGEKFPPRLRLFRFLPRQVSPDIVFLVLDPSFLQIPFLLLP